MGKLSQGLPKVSQRFVEEVIYGIQTRGFVRLSEIARSLNESIPYFDSENRETLKAVDTLSRHVENRGIYVIDRAGDRRRLFDPLLDGGKRFLIRLVGDRHLVYRGKKSLALDLARSCPLPYADRIIKEDKGREKSYHLEYGFRKVRLPDRAEQLYMVVVRGFGETPVNYSTVNKLYLFREKILWVMLPLLIPLQM